MMCVEDSTTIGPQIVELEVYKWGISISDRNKTGEDWWKNKSEGNGNLSRLG